MLTNPHEVLAGVDHERALKYANIGDKDPICPPDIQLLCRAYLDLRNTPIAKYHFDQAAELALLRGVTSAASEFYDSFLGHYHGFPGKLEWPQIHVLKQALAKWREGAKV